MKQIQLYSKVFFKLMTNPQYMCLKRTNSITFNSRFNYAKYINYEKFY